MNSQVCPKCGFQNPSGMTFCSNCGQSLSLPPQQQSRDIAPANPSEPPPTMLSYQPNFTPPAGHAPAPYSPSANPVVPVTKKSSKGLIFGLLGCGSLLVISLISLVVGIPLLQVAEILPKPLFGSSTPSPSNSNSYHANTANINSNSKSFSNSNSAVVSNSNGSSSTLLADIKALKQVGAFKQTEVKNVDAKDYFPSAAEVVQATYTNGSQFVASTNGAFPAGASAASAFDTQIKNVTGGGGTIYSNESKNGIQAAVYKYKDYYFIEVCSKATCSRNNSSDMAALKSFATSFGAALDKSSTNSGQQSENTTTASDSKTVSFGVVNGKAVNLVTPAYPPAAKAVHASGAVNVQVTIDTAGNVVSASATSGHPLLRQAAEQAARASKFTPTVLGGQAVKVTGVVVYNFEAQ